MQTPSTKVSSLIKQSWELLTVQTLRMWVFAKGAAGLIIKEAGGTGASCAAGIFWCQLFSVHYVLFCILR